MSEPDSWWVLLGAALLSLSTACHRSPTGKAHEPVEEFAFDRPSSNESSSREPSRAPFAPSRKDRPSDEIFARPEVLHIDIEVSRAGFGALQQAQWSGGGGERPTALATIRESGIVYNKVAMHLKGAAGSFRSMDDRPAMTLNFDKVVAGQSFHGLHKISLNNSVQDPSYLSEKICREMFDAAGVPVPRSGYALVKLNGRDLGFYVVLEGANKQFLKRYFKNAKGNLYDGGFVHDVDESLPVNSGDNPKDRSGLRALLSAEEEVSRQKSLTSLEKALDVDRFISMMAVEIMVWHWDGYSLNKNNWRAFHDLDANRMVFIPHGLDQTFGIGNRGPVPWLPRFWEGRVAATIMSTPEGRRRYRARFSQLFDTVFDARHLSDRIDQIEKAIQPVLAESNAETAQEQAQQGAWFKQQLLARHQELERQLHTPVHFLTFGNDGVAPLREWPRTSGSAAASRIESQGKPLLILAANGNGANSGFWRALATLPAGSYRFEGRVRAEGVVTPPGAERAGVGLRISKEPWTPHLTGTTDWTEFSYPFVLNDPGEVELICELTRALRGEAIFDLGTLRLVRVSEVSHVND